MEEEQISIKEKVSSTIIPTSDLYKVHILNEEGNVNQIYLFCGGLCSLEDTKAIFSEVEMAFYKRHDVEMIISDQLIHADDTIRDIKHKIVNEVIDFQKKSKAKQFALSVEELYLFGLSKKEIDMVKLYQKITENDTKKLTKEKFFQYATNISSDPYILDNGDGERGGLYNDIFSYEQWIELSSSNTKDIYSPIGMEFQEYYDFMFPTNPFKNQLWTESIRYENSAKNILLTLDRSILLDYTSSTDIMVCLAKDTFKFAEQNNINTAYFCELYYPFLFKLGVTNRSSLLESSLKLAEETNKYNNAKNNQKNTVTQLYREIYWTSNEPLAYSEKGIRQFTLTIRPYNYVQNFPLDLLFRNLHSSEKIPFIKYNPGTRRENMYRIHTNNVSTDGKKIPLLDETTVMKLSRDIGKSKQISLYVQDSLNIVVNINNNSEIEVLGHVDNLIDVEELNSSLLTIINPIVSELNNILQPSGYKMRPFLDMNDENIIHVRLTYQCILPIDVKMNLQKQIDYISPIFDVLNKDISKGAELRFKRIKNYKEMDARTSYIREVYDRTGNSEEVLQGLIDNFQLQQDEAIIIFAEFKSQFRLLKQKVVENPGFKSTIQMKSLKNELIFEIIDINSIKYIPELSIYIDVILRMSQLPKTVAISSSKLKKFKSKEKETKVVHEVVDTIVIPQETGAELYNPLSFSPKEDGEDDDGQIVNEGIDFDDADYYQDYDENMNEIGEGESSDDDYEGGARAGGAHKGGENTPENEDEEKFKANIDGMPIKNPTPFFERMKQLDPTLYVTEESSKFPLYSKACPSGDKRQPVILTDDEKNKIDETNPGSYGRAVLHGSSDDKKHWYICPRYWCLKTNSSISEEDVKAGKCGGIIPRNASTVPKGSYVYEFNNPKTHMKEGPEGKYTQHVPGFLKKEKHPDGLCIPCCFGKDWDSKDQIKRRASCGIGDNTEGKSKPVSKIDNKSNKTLSYIISSVSYPLPQSRWGFLPMALQLFLKSDASTVIDPKNSSLIRQGEKCLLRYGMEKSENQSFLASFAYFYAYKHDLDTIPTINEMRDIFEDAITIDMFVRYHNGNLVSTFRPKRHIKSVDLGPHEESDFYKTISLEDETQLHYLENTIASYDNFIKFITDEESTIDHTYLWDFFCGRNSKLLKDGMNLVILQMTDQDITERVQLICPSNAYSRFEYDETKETVILLKQDNFYEPIHLYEQTESIIVSQSGEYVYEFKRGDHIVNSKVLSKDNDVVHTVKAGETKKNDIIFKKAFVETSALGEIKSVLQLINNTSQKYCKPLPSLPKKYTFKQNIGLLDLIRLLKLHHYKIHSQVLNYRNKAIGLMVNKEPGQSLLFVPCFPSAMVKEISTKYMDDGDLWLDYRTTIKRLNGLSQDTASKILSKPRVKIIEDGLIIGILTETNQFVQINPPTEPIDKDGIPEVNHYSNKYTDGKLPSIRIDGKIHQSAEKSLTLDRKSEGDRIEIVKNINLETQFYNIFRTIVRMLLNQFEFRVIRKEILQTIDDKDFSYRGKLKHIEQELHKLLVNKIDFKEFDIKDLNQIEKVILCDDGEKCIDEKQRPPYCLISDDDKCVSLFPKKHLLSGSDNENVYYGRMADELIRYKRSRLFMFYPQNYMNITNTDFFINDNELFLLETRLTRDYFRNINPFSGNGFIKNINFDTAQPDMEYSGNIQNYSNKVTLKEQGEILEAKTNTKKVLQDFIIDCISHTSTNVVGNNKPGSWKTVFPTTAKEMFFNKTNNCSFIPIIYILQEVYFSSVSIQNIKTALWKGYQDLFKNTQIRNYIYSILRKQGKHAFMDKIKKNQSDFETILFSDDYYITDMDWWVFCTTAQLPVVLFSSTSLKTFSNSLQWIRLGGKNVDDTHFFVRSPAEIRSNQAPGYHVIQDGYKFNQLPSDIFVNAVRGDPQYTDNMQTIVQFLSKSTVVKVKRPIIGAI
jgi:hypothetical protein